MSYWTYTSGFIKVRPGGYTQPHARYILDTVLNHLPPVTGSEGNMKVYVVQPHGHTLSSSINEFGESMHFRRDAECDGWMRVQETYILVLEAHLRDRVFDETKVELNKWLCRLAKRLWVRDILVRLEGQDRELLITNAEPYEDMHESISHMDGVYEEPAWTEFLYWDRAKDSWYPMVLERKYFNNPENDAEYERRKSFYIRNE